MFQNLVSYKICNLDSAKIIEMKLFFRFNFINIFFLFPKHIKQLTVCAEIRHGGCKGIKKRAVPKE